MGFQSDKPRGRGRDGGGDLRLRGSMVDAHQEWMPMIIRHEPEIVSPWVGNVVLVEVVNDLTHLPS
jgi:hypothetical protein